MNRETFIDGDKTILNTDYYLYLLSCEQALKKIKKYIESIKDEPDADMYMKLGEYKEFKHILQMIDEGKEE